MRKPLAITHIYCRYSLAHFRRHVIATTVIDCGPLGEIVACKECADFYERITRATTRPE